MQLVSIHPLDHTVASAFVAALTSPDVVPGIPAVDGTLWWQERLEVARQGLARATEGRESGANQMTLTFAQVLAAAHPSYVHSGLSLTNLESTVDLGIGMLLRPPSRLFGELGMAIGAARTMPIRIDASAGMMGGAYMPARLVPQFRDLLRDRDRRVVRRLNDSGFDAVEVYGLLVELVGYATDRGLGLFEAVDAVMPDMPRLNPPGTRIILADRKRLDPETVKRLTESLKPPKRSFMDRMTGRRQVPPN